MGARTALHLQTAAGAPAGFKGRRQGQHSIHVNDQWRICFRWREGNAYDVEIVDYH
jgi:plasmid maintenance system killer protein